jgi:hypothetical protein
LFPTLLYVLVQLLPALFSTLLSNRFHPVLTRPHHHDLAEENDIPGWPILKAIAYLGI